MLSVDDIHTYYGDSHILQGVVSRRWRRAVRRASRPQRRGQDNNAAVDTSALVPLAQRAKLRSMVQRITRLPTHRIVRTGIAYVPEDRGIFPTVTVDEHLG